MNPNPTEELVARLRENDEMLRDGLQKNLTDAWHNVAMKQAARDSLDAADRLSLLSAEVERLTSELSATARDALSFDGEAQALSAKLKAAEAALERIADFDDPDAALDLNVVHLIRIAGAYRRTIREG